MLTIIVILLSVVGGIALFAELRKQKAIAEVNPVPFLIKTSEPMPEKTEGPSYVSLLSCLIPKPIPVPERPKNPKIRDVVGTDFVAGNKFLVRSGISMQSYKLLSFANGKAKIRRCTHHLREDAVIVVNYDELFVAV